MRKRTFVTAALMGSVLAVPAVTPAPAVADEFQFTGACVWAAGYVDPQQRPPANAKGGFDTRYCPVLPVGSTD